MVGCEKDEIKTIEFTYYSLPENKAKMEQVLADCEVEKVTDKNCENAELGKMEAMAKDFYSEYK